MNYEDFLFGADLDLFFDHIKIFLLHIQKYAKKFISKEQISEIKYLFYDHKI